MFAINVFVVVVVCLLCYIWANHRRCSCIVNHLSFFTQLYISILHTSINIVITVVILFIIILCIRTIDVSSVTFTNNLLLFYFFRVCIIVHIPVKQSGMGNSWASCGSAYIKCILLLLLFLMRFVFALCASFACRGWSRCLAVDHCATVKIKLKNFDRLCKNLVRHATHTKAVLLGEHHADRVLKCHYMWQVNTSPWVYWADRLQVRTFNRYRVLHSSSRQN